MSASGSAPGMAETIRERLWRTTSVGHGTVRINASATLPSSARRGPRRPCEPTTKRCVRSSRATDFDDIGGVASADRDMNSHRSIRRTLQIAGEAEKPLAG